VVAPEPAGNLLPGAGIVDVDPVRGPDPEAAAGSALLCQTLYITVEESSPGTALRNSLEPVVDETVEAVVGGDPSGCGGGADLGKAEGDAGNRNNTLRQAVLPARRASLYRGRLPGPPVEFEAGPLTIDDRAAI